MQWQPLTQADQLPGIIALSHTRTQVIFKHSTRCNISSIAKARLEKLTVNDDTDLYYLDLIAYRSVSNKIAELFNIHHESPQILVIKNGECTYSESHLGIRIDELEEQL